jgi:DNA mismatch repair protein MutL
MSDIIQLLPESIANQIAAGEVVQRPASVVKELMENAIDAGATSVKLIVKDAGKTLIQVIDNGCGMSETDARMSFQRHATSKIREAKDLFAIRTMGFRGEALPSIAAVAKVEMRTRLHHEELGTYLAVEDSKVLEHNACQCTSGTNISVKNLFFNFPARRKFLKSDAREFRHILDEFLHVAIAHEDLFFSLHHNGEEIYHLPPGNLRQRLVSLFGNNYNPGLVPLKEDTGELKVTGFVGKPDLAKKMRGEQFFFVNRRFIKSGYLQHAVVAAFDDLLPEEYFPFFVIFIDIAPAAIDVNVHPTKQEIKFDDDRLVYNYVKVVVKHALGQYLKQPTLDFEQEAPFSPVKNFGTGFGQTDFEKEASGNAGFITRASSAFADEAGGNATRQPAAPPGVTWQKLFDDAGPFEEELMQKPVAESESITIESEWSSGKGEMDDAGNSFSKQHKAPYQIHGAYIVSHIKSGFLLIDQQAAHERILYERYLEALENRQASTQKELFPRSLQLSPGDAAIMREILPNVNLLGYDIQEFGRDAFIMHGIPADLTGGQDEVAVLETLIHQFKENLELSLDARDNLARSLSRSAAIRRGQSLTVREMQELIDQLFACAMPFKSPTGRNCFLTFDLEELEGRFKA